MIVVPRPPLILLTILSLVAPLPARADVVPVEVPSIYAALADLETRVATIGFRLTTANARWCPDRTPQLGILLGDRRQYEPAQWPAARAAYRTSPDAGLFIAALAPEGPTARAGLQTGTPLAPVGEPANTSDPADPFARITAWENRLSALPPGAPATIIDQAGIEHRVTPVPGCASDFRVKASDREGGSADGRLILITAGLAQFARDDDELAAAVAHELAHNILRHRARLDAAGVRRGLLQQFGRNARLTRQTEIEADRLSVWLMQAAGYDAAAAIRFWEAFGRRDGRPLFQAGTHPRWRDRVAALTSEIAAMRAARWAQRDAAPPLIAAPPPLE